MAFTLKQFCEQNNCDINTTFDMVAGRGADILPCPIPYTGYFTIIKDDSIVCINEKLKVNEEIPLSAFTRAEFGIGSGQLWLQCIVNAKEFVFCSPRKSWKSPAGKLLIEKISKHTEILDMKEYENYTGKLFLLYMWK